MRIFLKIRIFRFWDYRKFVFLKKEYGNNCYFWFYFLNLFKKRSIGIIVKMEEIFAFFLNIVGNM